MYVREKDVIAVIDVRTDNSSASEFIKTLAAKGRVIVQHSGETRSLVLIDAAGKTVAELCSKTGRAVMKSIKEKGFIFI